MKKFDRKPVLIGALLGVVVFAQLPIDLRLLGLMPANGSELLMPLLLGNIFLGTVSAALGAVAMMSMLGDLTDENEMLNGLRQEGLIYSARAFFAKLPTRSAILSAGLYWICLWSCHSKRCRDRSIAMWSGV